MFKITVVGEISDFYPVKPLYACNVSCVFWLLLKAQTKSFAIKNFLLQARSGAQNQSTDRGGEFNGFKSNQTMHYNY